MQRILYVFGGPEFHPTEPTGKLLSQVLARDGRFKLEMTSDLDALANLANGQYVAVVVYTTGFVDDLTPEREAGLLDFVRNGGGFVGIHSATDSFRGSRAYIDMLGGEFLTHPQHHEFTVSITDRSHYITTRMPDLTLYDEMYQLQNYDPAKVTLLAQTPWLGVQMPMAYTRSYGAGRVVYLANGHTMQAWANPDLQKLALRAIAWSAGAELSDEVVRCGLLGYGGAFNMGKGHAGWIDATPGMKTVAMCDADPARVEVAKQELPHLQRYCRDADELLAMDDLDLVVVILPHNLHAPLAIRCLEAGKHVILEKPFCLNVQEADSMINAARQQGRMLSVFHNRRWDGDYLTIKDVIARGLIGDVFHIECGIGGYNHPGFWWRSDKAISGGVLHDWGAHLVDWVLNLVPGKISQVMGDLQKRVWHMVSNEDHGQAYIRFDDGVTADVIVSSIAASQRPKWRILGTKGSIEVDWDQDLKLVSYAAGIRQDSTVQVTLPSYGSTQYYRNIADHLLMGEELLVTAESARRVIGVIEAAEISASSGSSIAPCRGCE